MVIGVSEGVVTLKDIGGFLDAVVRAGAQPYPKLFDATDGVSGLSEADLKILSARPFSLIKRPMKIFRDIHSARKWLSYQPIRV